MATSHESNKASAGQETSGDMTDIKRKLVWRMGFAGLMIVALLAGLAVFDYYSAPPEVVVDPVQFTEPVPVPKKVITQPVTPAEPEAVKESGVSEPEMTSAPLEKNALALGPPPRPEVASRPALPRSSQSNPRPSTPVIPPLPVEPSIESRIPSPTAAAPSRVLNGYALQAGVFADPRRAEELQTRLKSEGIPATIEARVQVGPFRNKKEADVVREKLMALGIDSVLLVPKAGRR